MIKINRRRFLGSVGAGSLATASLAREAKNTPSATTELVRVGLIQMNGVKFDKEYNLAQAERWIRVAAARGAQILCTPECVVQGYPRVTHAEGTSFNDPELVKERARILAAAEPIPGPATKVSQV